ncbi:MAG: 3-phosphoshikimate 1-carboxyvinyltransferase [Thermoplasmata archaeon]
MSAVRIRPGPARGTVRAPPSKSYTHRALVVGHLAGRPFRVRHPLDCGDTRATASAVGRLGTPVSLGHDVWRVDRRPSRVRRAPVVIQCRESGTTLRFASALAAMSDRAVEIRGADRLSERPIDDLLEGLHALGASYRHLGGRGLPIEVRGPMHAGRVSLDASKSSQFASALLLTLPALDGDSWLELTGTVVSKPYLDATLAVLAHHGVRVDRQGRRFHIPGGQRYRGSGFAVPGDASSAAYLWAAAAVSGGSVRVEGISATWPQADIAVLDLLRAAGATVSRRSNGATVRGRTTMPFHIDLTDAPDLYPLAGVLAATTPGVSRIVGAEHVALKESDRKAEAALLARRLGATVESTSGGLLIRGTPRPRALDLRHLSDHRLVMSAAVGALAADRESMVGEKEAVRKSFPGFWKAFAALSGGTDRR